MRARAVRLWGLGLIGALATGGDVAWADDPLRSTTDSWTRDDAAHLLRRAGFGGTPEEIDRLHALGKAAAVDRLVGYEQFKANFEPPSILPYEPPAFMKEGPLSPEERQEVIRIRRQNTIVQAQNLCEWWLRRMITTPRPLEEKLVLFWHGHFTSGLREVEQPRFLYDQNELFRRYAKGSFGTLTKAVSYDPAMLRYLDGVNNVASHPNENYARELLELFTMGPGAFSENDVKSVARAFTGWTINRATGTLEFQEKEHDYGFKPLFGQFRRYNGVEVVDPILAQPATAKFIARKLWVYFAGTEPDAALLNALANVLRGSGYKIDVLLRKMFLSDAFYAPQVRFQAVKSPAELIAGTYRALEIRPLNANAMVAAMRRMGHELFQPPNVKGWDGGVKWVNTSTLLERYNFATVPLYGADAPREGEMMQRMMQDTPGGMAIAQRDANLDQPPYDPLPVLERYDLRTPEQVVDHYVKRLLQQEIPDDQRAALVAHLREHEIHRWDTPKEAVAAAVRGLIHLIISTPEYQVQ
ncbi:MAG: DUF1800 family protein [Phycisphaerae bacterium]|nr:MAG: DUF1800 domain-containing protein [Planctomycetota bacterium]KAB2947614.1 MAG: DUF1800 domain-containing protein [Phycisphaerae bacterium]MBE7455720.1 DUF1800 domain-containing protein [Planctomycetia bacterium]MCK6463356.1 DUF1800 domain-containing protein [Phycisphaerae bacterium]MCL4716978.1 DUF1800 family protein [Phycisphaerae bacterium]